MSIVKARSGTFTDNMKLPIHRWFRYSAGFSADWVESEIIKFEKNKKIKAVVLDPFVGSGTTAFAGCVTSNEVYGYDGHPFIVRIAKAKNLWFIDEREFIDMCNATMTLAESLNKKTTRYDETNLLGKCYSFEALSKLDNLREAYESLANENPIWELVWLNLTSILRACSGVGTAQWQYVLPNKTKAKVLDVKEAFLGKANLMASDMKCVKELGWTKTANLIKQDSREGIDAPECNLLITSPPYPNNYDYADATRLEMMFWGEIKGWSDLKHVVRPTLIRSCSQHSSADKVVLDDVLAQPLLRPIADELTTVTKELEIIRLSKGGRKTYHTMVAAYFYDLARILENVRDVMAQDSESCFVIGDSAPYGVHVPAERWLGEIAISIGFDSYDFEKLRDRNIKWKNRTHTVPLHEGRLWIKG